MKNKLVLFITGCVALVLSSCLKTDEITEVELIKNCQISSFKLSHDSIPGLDTVRFTIDQLTGRIFNIDSMPYGTKIEKVLCTITAPGSYALSSIAVTPEAYRDSTFYLKNLSDSIDFSEPVKFVMQAYDEFTTKVYIAQINIHQLQPDSMVWESYANPMINQTIQDQKVLPFIYADAECYFMYVKPADAAAAYQLYQTQVADPKNWEALALTGLPTNGLMLSQMVEYDHKLYVPSTDGCLYYSTDGLAWSLVGGAPVLKALLGVVDEGAKQVSALAAIAEQEGALTFFSMNKEQAWTAGKEVPAEFPLYGFAPIQYTAMYHEYLLVAGGCDQAGNRLNTSWATMDGASWALMGEGTKSFTKREGAMLASYDDKLLLLGGIDASNKALKDIYTSFDYGITWSLVDSMWVMPTAYQGRGYGSIVVDSLNYVNLFGGKDRVDGQDMNQLWRGRINRLIPKE